MEEILTGYCFGEPRKKGLNFQLKPLLIFTIQV